MRWAGKLVSAGEYPFFNQYPKVSKQSACKLAFSESFREAGLPRRVRW